MRVRVSLRCVTNWSRADATVLVVTVCAAVGVLLAAVLGALGAAPAVMLLFAAFVVAEWVRANRPEQVGLNRETHRRWWHVTPTPKASFIFGSFFGVIATWIWSLAGEGSRGIRLAAVVWSSLAAAVLASAVVHWGRTSITRAYPRDRRG